MIGREEQSGGKKDWNKKAAATAKAEQGRGKECEKGWMKEKAREKSSQTRESEGEERRGKGICASDFKELAIIATMEMRS